METLFAPWRMQWVNRDRPEDGSASGCTFCSLPGGDDRTNNIVAKSDHCYVLLNNMPYNPGHSMIIPFDHKQSLLTLTDEVLLDYMKTTQIVLEALQEALTPSGYNIGCNIGTAGGASIPDHLHTHVIPRWESDTSFMPLTANTTIVEEALDETYDRLRDTLLENDVTEPLSNSEAIRIDGTGESPHGA